jgi:hypothetical protein
MEIDLQVASLRVLLICSTLSISPRMLGSWSFYALASALTPRTLKYMSKSIFYDDHDW